MLVLTPFSSLLAREFMSSRLQGSSDIEYVRELGAETVIDYRSDKLDYTAWSVDSVLDLVGGKYTRRSSPGR